MPSKTKTQWDKRGVQNDTNEIQNNKKDTKRPQKDENECNDDIGTISVICQIHKDGPNGHKKMCK